MGMMNMKGTRGLFLKKRLVVHHKPLKHIIDLNDLLKYNAKTNEAIRGEGIMLIHPLDLEQLGQKVSEKHA
jgi:hypothetical protein